MRAKVGIATSEELADLVGDDRLVLPELERLGIAWEALVWSQTGVDWRAYDAIIVRSTWDYYEREAEFRTWLGMLAGAGVRVLNPVPVVLGNMDKVYLRELEAKGVETVPTHWIAHGDLRPVADLLRGLPEAWTEVVVKPSVSAGAFRTERLKRAELMQSEAFLHEVARDAHVLVQPFLPEILAAGEWSFLYFGQEPSHAVVKRAKAGDFRVQWTHGGHHEKREPEASLTKQVQAIFDLLPGGRERLVTRIDGVVRDGRFLLIETELIEPYLFLAEDPAAPRRLASALAQLLKLPV